MGLPAWRQLGGLAGWVGCATSGIDAIRMGTIEMGTIGIDAIGIDAVGMGAVASCLTNVGSLNWCGIVVVRLRALDTDELAAG